MTVRALCAVLILAATAPMATAQPAGDRRGDQQTYEAALKLLAGQVTWHVPPIPKSQEPDAEREKIPQRAGRHQWQWANAHAGEEWMLNLLPAERRKKLAAARAEAAKALNVKPGFAPIYWRLRDPAHADVAKAVALLKSITSGPSAAKARRWLAEIPRNNTVLTFDVLGGYATGKAGPVVMDCRNVDRVRFSLYRVRSAEDLLWVAQHVGRDFMFRDYWLQLGESPANARRFGRWDTHEDLMKLSETQLLYAVRKPAFAEADRIAAWEVQTAELKAVPHDWDWNDWRRRHDWDEPTDGDSAWFGDRSYRHRDRVRKTYRRDRTLGSAWLCDRIVQIPAAGLKKPGACILVAEANGQRAVVPVIVEPMSLTLRRGRDGVFAMVSNHTGDEPVVGATVRGLGTRQKQKTDTNGVAFLKMFADGDRMLVAEANGRYAVGGFGELFQGLYVSRYELRNHRERRQRHARLRQAVKEQMRDLSDGHVYADRHVVAAYTDRPTYRPGQQVRFKLIVRELAPLSKAAARRSGIAFRAGDFEMSTRLLVPKTGTQVRYDVLNPRGRVIGTGTLTLNDYGTASGELTLSSESATGRYSLRVRAGGVDRVVPEVFAVKFYRRPNFEVRLSGVPRVLKDAKSITVKASARYYFGRAVASGKARVRLVRPDEWKPLAEREAELDDRGRAEVRLKLPRRIADGEYFVICEVTDDSGRTVSRSVPCRIERSDRKPVASGLGRLPRFIAFGKPLTVRTDAKEIVVTCLNSGKTVHFERQAPTQTIRFRPPAAGWILVSAAGEQRRVFVYDDTVAPENAWTNRLGKQRKRLAVERTENEPLQHEWVNLTRYDGVRHEEEHDRRWDDAWDHERVHLWALFDRQHVRVGGSLRVLLYVPYEKARILLTVEGRTIVDYVIVERKPGTGPYRVVQIPIHRRYVPNFYLQGRILPAQAERSIEFMARQIEEMQKLEELEEADDDTEDPRWCRVDVLDPAARPHGQKLDVTVGTDAKVYQPGESVEVTMKVTDPAGRPRAAEVSLGAVDASIYSFGEDGVAGIARLFADPRPQRRYARKAWRSYVGTRWVPKRMEAVARAQAMRQMRESLQELAKAMDALSKAAGVADVSPSLVSLRPPPLSAFGQLPIGVLPGARLRTDFRETATWQPHLRTGKDGVAKATFRLPDSLTAWRLTAVAVTKQTEIGTARSRIRARMPIVCQLFLPRFAIEGDRLLAVGVLRNNTSKDRTLAFGWEVEGATAERPAKTAAALQVAGGKTTVSGQVNVAAGASARLGLWLKAESAGTVTVTFRGGDGESADAERRTLPVHVHGRPREFTASGTVAGKHEVRLPEGFTADTLTVTISRSDPHSAMQSLRYLVGYPYGCVEQTMSRFLPAVMVRYAARQVKIALPAEIEKKLPDVLAKGLERLYNFQHDDGGWGWWKADKTDDRMTIYVTYGLLRCRQLDVKVDGDVLAKAIGFLKRRIGDAKRPLSPLRAARARFVLALAGKADRKALAAAARQADDDQAAGKILCNLALACREAGLKREAKRLWQRVARGGDGDSPLFRGRADRASDVSSAEKGTVPADALALLLKTQLAFGAKDADCRRTAAKLMALRRGHRWASTRATSWAIDAVAQMLGRAKVPPVARRMRVAVGGRVLLDVTDPRQVEAPIFRVDVPADLLAGREAVPIELLAGDADDPPVRYAISAKGTQRLTAFEPTGEAVKLRRRYLTVGGEPLAGPVAVGDLVQVRLTCELLESRDYMIIEDRRPAGFEFAGDRVFGSAGLGAAHVEFRDDRVCVFGAAMAAGLHEVVYYLRAETPGISHVLPGVAYPMYSEEIRGETGSGRLQVRAMR